MIGRSKSPWDWLDADSDSDSDSREGRERAHAAWTPHGPDAPAAKSDAMRRRESSIGDSIACTHTATINNSFAPHSFRAEQRTNLHLPLERQRKEKK